MDEKRIVRPTSRNSADYSDIVLRTTAITRLVFRPVLVVNPNDTKASVHGTFLFQRKGPKEDWKDARSMQLPSLRKGEEVRIDLHATEILRLYQELSALYKLYASSGIPYGVTELVPVDSTIGQLASIPPDQVRTYLTANQTVGANLLANFLSWAVELKQPEILLPRLIALTPEVMRELNAAVGLGSLKQALALWTENKDNDDEEFWQKVIAENSFVLEHVYAWPVTVVKGKAYLGGKSILNTGGKIVDFLLKNYITNNAALVEIKTPATPLLGPQYREGIYSPSSELSGGIVQSATYRDTLQKEFRSSASGMADLHSFDPSCTLIIGSRSSLDDGDQLRSFELFRRQTSGVSVITFDELFEKTQRLIDLLGEPSVPDDDFPDSFE